MRAIIDDEHGHKEPLTWDNGFAKTIFDLDIEPGRVKHAMNQVF